MWQLPILENHREEIKGRVADICNSGKSKYGGASTAAAFLEHFVEEDVKWSHIDIAGPSSNKEIGCTGHAVQTLISYFKSKVE